MPESDVAGDFVVWCLYENFGFGRALEASVAPSDFDPTRYFEFNFCATVFYGCRPRHHWLTTFPGRKLERE